MMKKNEIIEAFFKPAVIFQFYIKIGIQGRSLRFIDH